MTRAVIDATAESLVQEILFDPAGRADPYPRYRALRERAPVLRTSQGSLVLSRYAECQAALGEPKLGRGVKFRREQGAIAPLGALDANADLHKRFFDQAAHNMLFADPPDHTRLRRLAGGAFTPARVRALRPAVEEMTSSLLHDALERVDVELISEIALPLPMQVIGELVGVPPDDRAALQPLVRASTAGIEPGMGADAMRSALDAAAELGTYFFDLLELRRRQPADDLLTALAAAGESDDRLSVEEVVATAILLFSAGFETTTNLIGNGMLALLLHPGELQRWQLDPSIAPLAVEELLRWDSPVQINTRFALAPAEVAGVPLEPGDGVLALQGAANRDPDRFSDPEQLDLTRPDNKPLSFGWGIHHCLGAPLARMEGDVFFTALLRRCRKIEWMDDEPAWRDSFTLRGLDHLHLRLSAA